MGLIGQAVRVPRRNSWNLARMGRGGVFVALSRGWFRPICNRMGRGGLFVAPSRGWFRPICNTMGRGGSRPRAQRERQRERQRETRNPGQPTPTTHPGKKYAVRDPPHSDLQRGWFLCNIGCMTNLRKSKKILLHRASSVPPWCHLAGSLPGLDHERRRKNVYL